jgi:CheY-like chemotaxis protein
MAQANQTTVMIVDDQPFVRQMMGKALGGSYQVIESTDGMAAINLIRDRASRQPAAKIDCIVSDINMLPMNGLEFVKAIRAGLAPIARDTPILMLTGHAEKPFIATAIALDVGGFLVKPVSAAVFRERVERAIGAPIIVKSVADYATLIIPELDAKDLWSSSAVLSRPVAPVRAGDLAGGNQLPKPVPLSDMKVGDRLAEDLLTDEGVLVVPIGSRVTASLLSAVKDLAEIVKLPAQVALFSS